MQVKLVFEKSFQEFSGLSSNTFSEDLKVTLPDGFDRAHLVSAVCYDPSAGGTTNDRLNPPSDDFYATIWDYGDVNTLVGKLLTYIDATYTDTEQRKAHKDLVKDLVYGYAQDLRTRAVQTVQSQTK